MNCIEELMCNSLIIKTTTLLLVNEVISSRKAWQLVFPFSNPEFSEYYMNAAQGSL